MLPTSTRGNRNQKDSALGAAYGVITSYKVHSNDVLDGQLRITVEEEDSGRSVWFSERFLTENEIVETLKDAASSRIRWSTHRPKSGWYIRIRSPLFPSGSSVPLLPVEPPEAVAGSGTLSFLCQTQIDLTPPPPAYGSPDLSTASAPRRESESSEHSYPPQSPYSPGGSRMNLSPDAVSIERSASGSSTFSSLSVGSTTTLIANEEISAGGSGGASSRPAQTTADSRVRSEVTRFIVKPVPAHAGSTKGASHRLSLLPTTLLGKPHHSFTIQPSSGALPPVLSYHDTTPMLGAARSTGTIELDHGVARCLGVEPSWWIAVALAYVEFLETRDGYIAASSG